MVRSLADRTFQLRLALALRAPPAGPVRAGHDAEREPDAAGGVELGRAWHFSSIEVIADWKEQWSFHLGARQNRARHQFSKSLISARNGQISLPYYIHVLRMRRKNRDEYTML